LRKLAPAGERRREAAVTTAQPACTLAAAEFGVRTAAPGVAADLTRHVADLLDRARAAGAIPRRCPDTERKAPLNC
jgi:hypothetical protein